MEKGNKFGLFSFNRRGMFYRNVVSLLLISMAMPWQAFADDQLFRETKNNFTPHPFVQPDLSTGAFVYSQPLTLPQGRAGMQPDIKLTYNSSGGKQDSIVGYGWSLNIPYIEHWNKNGSDRLYNQDLAHTFFSSSLSGELLPIATTSPVNGSVLGVSVSTPRLSPLSIPIFQQFLDFATSVDALSGLSPQTTASATDTIPFVVDLPSSSEPAATSTDIIASSSVVLSPVDIQSSTSSIVSTTISSIDISDENTDIERAKTDELFRPNGALSVNTGSSGTELVGERHDTTKTFFYGYNKDGLPDIRTHIYLQPIHYLNPRTGKLDDIDVRFASSTTGFIVTHAPYQVALDTTGSDHLLRIQHGEQVFAIDPINGAEKRSRKEAAIVDVSTTGTTVVYPDLLGNGIDLRVTTFTDRIKKEAVIHDFSALASTTGDYFDLPFQVSFNSPVTISSEKQSISESGTLTSSNKVLLTDSTGNITTILPPHAISANDEKAKSPESERTIPIDIEYTATKNGFVMTKHLSLSWLKTANYPVVTDATFYYPNSSTAVDGEVGRGSQSPSSWADLHDGIGQYSDYTSTAYNSPMLGYPISFTPNQWQILRRAILNFDTSSIGSGKEVTSAALHLTSTAYPTNDLGESVNITGVAPTVTSSLSPSDYNIVKYGSTTFTTNVSISSWPSTGSSITMPLNGVGLNAINPTGITSLAVRLTADINNVAPNWSSYGPRWSYASWYASESGANGPYLEITTTATNSPTSLFAESQTNPLIVTTQTPRFSAITPSASSSALITHYQIQVTSNPLSWTSPVWDSGQSSLSSSTPSGMRTPNINYGGSALSFDRTKYYWRIRLWNAVGSSTAWSNTGDYFIMGGKTDYGAKVESGDFIKYTHEFDDSWSAYDKRGVKYIFGTGSSSRIQSTATSTQVFRWYINSMIDPNGNAINYSYATDSGQVYPYRIDYTANGTSSPIYQIEFVRENRQDIATTSTAGFPVVTKQRIKEILVRTNGQLTRRYQLGYGIGDNTARSILASVQESGWNASAGTTTLPAAKFAYSTSTNSWSGNSNPNMWQLPGSGYDFVYIDGSDNGLRVIDLNGDGLPDISYADPNAPNAWINTGKTWATSSSYHLPIRQGSGSDIGARLGDVNGDGIVDQVQAISCHPGDNCNVPGAVVPTNNAAYISPGWSSFGSSLPVTFVSTRGTDWANVLIDVNGDGLADVVGTGGGYINDGTQWVADPAWTLPVALTNSKDNGARMTDFNGDGLVDELVGNTTNGRIAYINTGHGWQLSPTWAPPIDFLDAGASNDTGNRIADFNGDGLPDLVTNDHTLYLNTGRGWVVTSGSFPVSPVYVPFPTSIPYDQGVVIDDVNGDGLPDVMQSILGPNHCNCSNPVRNVWLKDSGKPDLLVSATSEKGGRTTVTYSRTTKLSANGSQPNPSLPIAFDIVSSITSDPNFGGAVATTTYSLNGGSYYYADANNRQMAGFASSTQSNVLGYTTRTYYHRGDTSDTSNGEYNDSVSKIGKPYRVEILDGTTTSANLFSRTINKWARADYGDGRNFVKLVQSLTQTFDGDSSHRDTAASTTYDDSNGNVLAQVNYGEVNGNSDGTFADVGTDLASTTYSYAASTTNTTMSLPARELVSDQFGVAVKDTKWTYDGLSFGALTKGNQTKEEKLKSGSSYASTTKTYDSYGNVLVMTDQRGGTTTNAYDAYNLYPATTTNALGKYQTFTYDYATGKIATTTDVNGRTFATVYDGLGRPLVEKQPDFTTPTTLVTKTLYTYTDSTTTPSLVLRQDYLNSATTSDLYTYIDGLGRTIQTKKEAELANGWVVNDTIYNSIGSVGSQSLPYFNPSSAYGTATTAPYLFTNYTYDPAGRVKTIADILGTTTNSYNDWSLTVTDPLGNRKDMVKDAYGNLASVVEYPTSNTPATTTYAWNLLGKMTKLTDALSNVRNFTYDTLGRLLTSEDLHASGDSLFGTTTYTYDDANNVIAFLNPRGQTVNSTYDALNRKITEDYTGGSGTEISYTYDNCTNGIGRLCQVQVQGSATTTSAYNPIGLLSTEAKKITSMWSTTSYAYLRNGAQDTITYPDLGLVSYIYDDAGLLDKVTDKESGSSTGNIVNKMTWSANGELEGLNLANGVNSTSTYDKTKKYRLTNKVSAIGGTNLQNIAYTYDAVGNMTQFADTASTSATKSVNYTYDNLYRLLSASTTAVAIGTSPYKQLFSYDKLGNILGGPAGAYTYGGTGYANPDAVTTLVSSSTSAGGGSSISTSTPTFIQSGISTTSSVLLGAPVTTGNLIIVGVTIWNTSIPTNAVSDNKGNTYTRIADVVNASTDHLALFYAKNVTGGSSYTVTSSIGGTLSVHEYSGIATSSPLDKTASTTGSSGTALSSGTVTPSVTNELIFGLAWSELDGSSWTAGSGYTLRTQETNNNSAERSAGEDRVATNTSAISATFTTGGSAPWTAMIATFKPKVTVSGGGATTTTYATTTLSYDQAGNLTSSATSSYTWNYRNRLTLSGNGLATSTYGYDEQDNRTYLTDNGVTTIFPNMLYNRAGTNGTTTKHIFANGFLLATIESGTSTSGGPGTIAFDASSTSITTGYNAGPVTKTWTHTTSGSNRLLVLSASIWQDTPGTGTITSATYNGTALTKVTNTRTGGIATELWYLKNPPSGANTMSVTVTGATDAIKLGASSFTNVDQSAPLDTSTTAGASTGNPSISLTTSTVNDVIVTTLNRFSTTAASTNRTKIYNNAVTSTLGASSYQLTTTAGSYSDTYTGSANQDWSMISASFKAVATGGGTGSTTIRYVSTDILNGSNIVTDGTGAVVESLDYLPYGGIRVDSKSAGYGGEKRKYISSEFDQTSGLNYMNARYQNGNQGQFISQDPVARDIGMMGNMAGYILDVNQPSGQYNQTTLLSNPQMLNAYSYAVNNSITKSDPSGLGPIDLALMLLFTPVQGSYDPIYEAEEYAAQNSIQNKVIGAAMASPIGVEGRGLAPVRMNQLSGIAREAVVKQEQAALNPAAEIWSQRMLRNADGSKAIDSKTGMGRVIDFAVVQDGKVINRLEVTSQTANKNTQLRREERIINNGGTFIRNPSTKELVNFANTGGVTTPATITRKP